MTLKEVFGEDLDRPHRKEERLTIDKIKLGGRRLLEAP